MSWSTTLKNRQQLRAQIEAGEDIAVMFSDIRGFTAYTAERGDRAAYQLSQLHEALIKERIEEYGGVLVKALGDGIMAALAEPSGGIKAAVAIQRAIRFRNQGSPDEPIDVGIGLASGKPVMSETDMIGHSVNLAQRISSLAKGGQILVTEAIRDAILLPEDLRYLPFGKQPLKGVGREPLYEVLWMGEISRLSDAEDHFTLVLTEKGTLVLELAKEVQAQVEDGLKRLEHEKGGAFSAFLGRTIAHFTQKIIDSSLGAFGIAREQDLDQVELFLKGKNLAVRLGKKELLLKGVDSAIARTFLARLDELKQKRMKQPTASEVR
jgi:class 3 adenylate cyclase